MRLGDLDALKKALEVTQYNDIDDLTRTERLIDNAPTVSMPNNQIIWEQGYECGRNEKRPQSEITEEDIQNAIRAGYENGYSMAQAKYQRPQGEWIEDKVAFHFVCDQCGCALRQLKSEVFEGDYDYNLCPNCGAERVGGES